MSISKTKTTGAIMIAGREVDDACSSIAGIAFYRKRGIIDAVGVLIQKDKQIGRTGPTHFTIMFVSEKLRIRQPLTSTSIGFFSWITPKRLAHGNTADPWHGLP